MYTYNSNNRSSDDQWDPRFILEFEDGQSFRKVHAKFIEAAAHDRRTGDMLALDPNGKLQRVTKISVIPPKYR